MKASTRLSSTRLSQLSLRKGLLGLVLSGTTLFMAACGPQLDDVEADAPVPEEQADVPASAEVGSGSGDLTELVGETVTVSTKVTEVLSPNLFTVYDVESLRGEEVLAITDIAIPEPGTNIEVTGEIMELDEAAIKSAYDVELEPDVVEAYAEKPYLAVQAIEQVD